jgi:filamentous hemagglutinin
MRGVKRCFDHEPNAALYKFKEVVMKKNYRIISGMLAAALVFGLALMGCKTESGVPSAAEIAVAELAAALGPHASAWGLTVTVSRGTATLSTNATVASGVTLVVAGSGVLVVADSGVLNVAGTLAYTGTIDLAATAIVNVNGTLTNNSGTITEAQGAKIVYSSTANTGLDNVYVNGTNSTWTIGAGAYFTEIAGTSEPRRNWQHEISGGTVTLHKRATYGSTDDASELTVKTGGILTVAGDGTTGSTPRILGIRSGGTLINNGTIIITNTGTITVNGTVTQNGTYTNNGGTVNGSNSSQLTG